MLTKEIFLVLGVLLSMDPTLECIFIGVFINGLSSLLGNTGKKFLNSFSRSKSLKSIISDTELNRIENAISKESERIELKSIQGFIESVEVASIVQQIYALEITEKSYNINEVQEEFNLLFSRYFEMSEEKTKHLSSILLQTLVLGCHEICSRVHLRQELLDNEANLSLEFNILRDQINTIQENIKFLSTNKLNVKEIHEFIEKYRKSVENKHELFRSITYNYGTQTRVSFDDVYVYPNLVKVPPKIPKQSKRNIEGLETNVEDELINLDQFLSIAYRAVILGDPGAGKTTLMKRICYDLTNSHREKLFLQKKITPVLVTLREYQAKNFEKDFSILDYITTESNSYYQAPVPNGAFEYLLLNGYILLVFDGLDELLEISSRERIVDEIESFCNHYPSVPVLVTSRKIGYEQAPLNGNIFEKFELASFDYEQVQEYVYKWFALDLDLTEEEKVSRASSFLEESEIVEDLRSNCLMLSLMCSIYKEENYIPENRPQIYQECAEMLFKKWDKERKIKPKLYVPESKVKPLVAYLAYSIFINESLQEGVTESKLIAMSIEFLHGTVYVDRDKAELAARDFISFCKGRAWILTYVASTKKGESVYQFTHRTFLEYFTAYWLIWNNNLEEISDLLLDKIAMEEWDEVAQLIFQIKCENSADGEELFSKLLQRAETVEDNSKFNLLSFSARCLQFIIPSPKITRDITYACFSSSDLL